MIDCATVALIWGVGEMLIAMPSFLVPEYSERFIGGLMLRTAERAVECEVWSICEGMPETKDCDGEGGFK